MNIILYRTTKRENSTATPDSKPAWFSQRLELDNVTLKDETSVLNPKFICRLPQNGHDGQNYLWAFGRYYWITDVVILHNHLFELQCRIDPLGSYRGHIRNTQAFVLYDSTPNTEIPDRRLGVKTTAVTAQSTVEMPWGFASGKGSKFVALVGNGQNEESASATGVYIMDDANIDKLGGSLRDFSDLFYNSTWNTPLPNSSFTLSDGTTLTNYTLLQLSNEVDRVNASASTGESINNSIGFFMQAVGAYVLGIFNTLKGLFASGDAMKNVKAAYWLPFDCSDEGSGVTKIALGSWVEDISAKKVTSPFKDTILNVSIPWQYSDWRNVANTEIQLFIPLIGNINIPASAVKGKSNITIKMVLNMFSGAFSVRVQCGDETLGSYGADCQMPILIGSSNANSGAIINTIASGATMVAGAATGGAALTAGAAVGLVASGFESLTPISTSVGGIGGGAGNKLGIAVVCTTICHNTSDNPADLLPIIGTPTNVLKTLSGSGYCQTMQAHMNMNAVVGESYPTQGEVDAVNAALDGGVFLE